MGHGVSIGSRILAYLWDLPKPDVRDIVEHRDLGVAMSDGVELATDRYHPRHGENLPVILIRSPYGREAQFRDLALVLAERGFQVILQSCRGTGGSGGAMCPSFQEAQDGADTIDWLRAQTWYCGKLALLGTSYLGNAVWAAVYAAGPQIAAIALHATLSDARAETYAFEGFTLEGCLAWTRQLTQTQLAGTVRLLLRGWLPAKQDPPSDLPALHSLPLRDADRSAVGHRVSWWQDWVNHAEPGDPFWKPLDYSTAIEASPSAVMIGGWHDIFLPWQVKDFEAMQAAGRPVTLTIGPWTHSALEAWGESVRQALALFRAQLLDQPVLPRAPVRLYVMGAAEWRDYSAWPPPGFASQAFYLRAGGGLSTEQPPCSLPSCYIYDPEDPTPAICGPRFSGVRPTGNMAKLEARPDVLQFTAEPLGVSLEVVGPVSAELFFHSSLEHTDFFLVLCDVAPNGRSMNVCDGYIRVRPNRPARLPDGTTHIHVDFWPTAYCYLPGHRLRVIVSSGAHPRYARNLGSGEPLGEAVTFCIARQQIFHDPDHPSRIMLPVSSPRCG